MEVIVSNANRSLKLLFQDSKLSEPKVLKFKQFGIDLLIAFGDPGNNSFQSLDFRIPKGVLESLNPRTLELFCDFENLFASSKNHPYCMSAGDDKATWMGVFGNEEEIRLNFFQLPFGKSKVVIAPPPKFGKFLIKRNENHKTIHHTKGTACLAGQRFSDKLFHLVGNLVAVNSKISINL